MRFIGLALALLTLTACQSQVVTHYDQRPTPTERRQSALDQMELVFEGNYSKDEIKAALDDSFRQLGMKRNESNYRHAGDVLVALSNYDMEKGCDTCTEMAILDYMNRNYLPSMGKNWRKYAAFASSFLLAEETQ
jgi:hypothetical protein